MPINIDPIEIPVEEIRQTIITADKLHILKLIISDPTKEKPGIELQCLPYFDDGKGNKQFGTQILTIRTVDLYAAIPNLAKAGFTKIQEAMQAVFDAAGELVHYRSDRIAEADAIRPELDKAQAEYQAAVDSNDDAKIKTAQENLNSAMQRLGEAQAAANDPANPPLANANIAAAGAEG